MCHRRRREDRRGQRRHRQGESEREDDDGRQERRRVARPRLDQGEQGEPAAGDDRSERHGQPRADALRQPAGPGREGQHDERDRQQRRAGFERRVAQHLLELDRQQKERAAEGAVDREGHHVGARELPGAEDVERQHGMLCAVLPGDESQHRRERDRQRRDDAWCGPALVGSCDQPVDQRAQPDCGKPRPGEIEPALRRRVARLRHVALGDPHDRRHERQIDEEDQPPGDGLDQVAADERSDGGRDAAQPRPGADGLSAVFGTEGGLDDRQALGYEQRGADSLEGTSRDQHAGAGRDPTEQRGGGEPQHADDEAAPAPVVIADRAADQDEGRQGQSVGRHGPLERLQPAVEGAADRRQGDVHDGAVDHDDAGAQDGGRDHPAAARRVQLKAACGLRSGVGHHETRGGMSGCVPSLISA